MPRKYSARLLASNQSLGDFGMVIEDIAGWFSTARRSLVRQPIQGRAGSLVTRIEDGDKVVRVQGTVFGDTVIDRNTQVDQLLGTLLGQPVVLELDDVTGRTTGTGRIEGSVDVTPYKGRSGRRAVAVAFTVTMDGAYITDSAPLPYGFGPTATPMPLGTAPVAPVIQIMGAVTNPVLTYRSAAGAALAAITFTIALAGTDYLEIDCGTWRVEKIVSGTRSDAYSVYAGQADNLPLLDPADGLQVYGSYPTLEVSGGSGLALYPRMWR